MKVLIWETGTCFGKEDFVAALTFSLPTVSTATSNPMHNNIVLIAAEVVPTVNYVVTQRDYEDVMDTRQTEAQAMSCIKSIFVTAAVRDV